MPVFVKGHANTHNFFVKKHILKFGILTFLGCINLTSNTPRLLYVHTMLCIHTMYKTMAHFLPQWFLVVPLRCLRITLGWSHFTHYISEMGCMKWQPWLRNRNSSVWASLTWKLELLAVWLMSCLSAVDKPIFNGLLFICSTYLWLFNQLLHHIPS